MKKLALLLFLPVFACSTPANIKLENNQYIGQVSPNNGAKIDVKINFDNEFKVKASSNGVAAKTVNDVRAAKLYLTSSNGTNPLLASNVKFSSSVIVYPTGSTTKTYTFFNVPAGTYYVAVELFSDTTGTANIVEPITYDSSVSGDTAFGLTGGKRGLALSTNSATVTAPAMTYSFSDSSSAFSVSPKLLNAVGASLDTTLTPQSGSSTPTGTITIQ